MPHIWGSKVQIRRSQCPASPLTKQTIQIFMTLANNKGKNWHLQLMKFYVITDDENGMKHRENFRGSATPRTESSTWHCLWGPFSHFNLYSTPAKVLGPPRVGDLHRCLAWETPSHPAGLPCSSLRLCLHFSSVSIPRTPQTLHPSWP